MIYLTWGGKQYCSYPKVIHVESFARNLEDRIEVVDSEELAFTNQLNI